MQSVFFEINGQPRTIEIEDRIFSKGISKKTKIPNITITILITIETTGRLIDKSVKNIF